MKVHEKKIVKSSYYVMILTVSFSITVKSFLTCIAKKIADTDCLPAMFMKHPD